MKDAEELKSGVRSQKKAKVLVMVENEKVDDKKRGKKSRKCGHIKMRVINDLKTGTFESDSNCG